ncbi:MAG: enoyl-CoA hydratase-related protein [Hyphomicrobiales bacterium]
MSEDPVLVRVEDAIGTITINRPKALNALDVETLIALEAALTALEKNAAVRVIVVTGAGDRAFVAGGDIADLNSRQGLAHYLEFGEVIHRVFRRFETCDKPTIAAVNGWALGGGTELLLCLDIRLMAEKAQLGLPEITLGIFPGAGGSQRLLREVSPAVAREMLFTGRRLTAQEAKAVGLVNAVVPAEQLAAEVKAMASAIAQKSPLALKLLKRALLNGADMPLAAALAHEQAMIGLSLDSNDAHEGLSAFLEKRAAVFKGE